MTEQVDGALSVLARQLTCSLCGAPFSSQPCSPVHETVQNDPRQHRLIKPLLALAWREGHQRGLRDADLQDVADNPYDPS